VSAKVTTKIGRVTVLEHLHVEPALLTSFCEHHHITKLALFGSVLRDDFGGDSDIDVLVAFEEGHTPGWEFFALEDELLALLGSAVDLGTFGGLQAHARKKVLVSTQVVYDVAA
jgi:predicted nucleotidyltransferase